MAKLLLGIAVVLLACLELGSAYRLVCYFANWAQYRPGAAKYTPDDIDPCMCTHLIFAFAVMKNNEVSTYGWNDVTLYKSFNALKTRTLDFFNLMTYDFYGPWNSFAGENSPLYALPNAQGNNKYFNMAGTVEVWKQEGAPAEKLNAGFAGYGHSFRLSTSNTAPGAPANGAGPAGHYTQQSGFLAYFEICLFLKEATEKWDASQMVPYAYKGNEWVGYDNPQSFEDKIKWLKKSQIGGAMMWTLSLDDFSGTFCHQGRYPLVSKLHNLLGINKGCVAPPLPTTPGIRTSTINVLMDGHTWKIVTLD
ncbi:hypothetical protein scyTo_0018048 [Scyliorhinus torazame]|uniref:GH18 domain-containing protein n=1 Tax=Scyliorhinus torazame TaxID=75743 RepID=A0A401Q4E3_SCYTO|nr:hypothetical protein [Scyliorhinus torazame]